MERVLEYRISSEYDGANVLTVLKKHFNASTNLIKELKKYDEGIQLNGEHIRVVDFVKNGDILKITIRDNGSQNIIPKNIPIDIVHEDEDVLVINKQPDMPTHPSMGNYENSLANAVMYHYRQKGEDRAFRAVNRLDKDTSGLMTVAKNSYAHAILAEEIKNQELKRKYMCIVCGKITDLGTVDAPIKRACDSVINRIVAKDGQRAVTHYRPIKNFGDYTLLEIELETGRTHQIRVHMSHIGCPLVGDWLYGTEDKKLAQRQLLHSCYLSFTHPITGQKMQFNNEMADDMKAFVEKVLQNS